LCLVGYSADKFDQRQFVHHADVFTSAERDDVGIIEMPVLDAQHVGTGGNRRVQDAMALSLGSKSTTGRPVWGPYNARDRAQEIHVAVDLVPTQSEQCLHSRITQHLADIPENERR
jgi:hypothetical protein